jgi:hypothetical protein
MSPANNELKLSEFLHPIELKVRERYLQLVNKHGVGKWGFDELEWEIYVKNADAYEALSEEEKFILNNYMIAFRSLYK